MNLTKIYVELGAEKAKALISFHYFSGCNTVEKDTRKSNDTWTKLFLNRNLDIFKVFQLISRHIKIEIMHNLEVFAAKVCSRKH